MAGVITEYYLPWNEVAPVVIHFQVSVHDAVMEKPAHSVHFTELCLLMGVVTHQVVQMRLVAIGPGVRVLSRVVWSFVRVIVAAEAVRILHFHIGLVLK